MSSSICLKLVSFLQNAATDPWATYPIAAGRGQPIQKVPSRDGYPRGSSRIVQSRWEMNGPAAQCIGYYPPWIVSHYPRTRCAVQWQAGSPGRLTYHRLSLPMRVTVCICNARKPLVWREFRSFYWWSGHIPDVRYSCGQRPIALVYDQTTSSRSLRLRHSPDVRTNSWCQRPPK